MWWGNVNKVQPSLAKMTPVATGGIFATRPIDEASSVHLLEVKQEANGGAAIAAHRELQQGVAAGGLTAGDPAGDRSAYQRSRGGVENCMVAGGLGC